jgi:ankyrin repeat protein
VEIAKLLLDYGADPNFALRAGNVTDPHTPLTEAVRSNHYELAMLLCERGANPNVAAGRPYDNLLVYATGTRDAKLVQLLLEHGADPDGKMFSEYRALHVAAVSGDVEKAMLLVAFGGNLNGKTKQGATPLFIAAVLGHTDFCEFLLSKGAQPDVYSACALGKQDDAIALLRARPDVLNTPDPCLRRTLLHWAARSGNSKLVAFLLAGGATVDPRAPRILTPRFLLREPPEPAPEGLGFRGETPLHSAVTRGHLDVVQLLVGHGADIAACDAYENQPLHLACSHHFPAIVRFLLGRGADVHARNECGLTPLLCATKDKKIVEFLLAAGADPNVTSPCYGTPLLRAAYEGSNEVADLLLARGAKIDLHSACLLGKEDEVNRLLAARPELLNKSLAGDHYGEGTPLVHGEGTPLLLATRAGQLGIVKLLMAKGAPFTGAQLQGWSPLQFATKYGQRSIAEFLLEARVAGKVLSPEEKSFALLSAATYSQAEMVRFLLTKNADARIADALSNTPLHCVGESTSGTEDRSFIRKAQAQTQREDLEVARLLLQAGASINARNSFGATPLHGAAQRGQTELAAFLLAKGADINARDNKFKTPLDYAERRCRYWEQVREHIQVVELLRKRGGRR